MKQIMAAKVDLALAGCLTKTNGVAEDELRLSWFKPCCLSHLKSFFWHMVAEKMISGLKKKCRARARKIQTSVAVVVHQLWVIGDLSREVKAEGSYFLLELRLHGNKRNLGWWFSAIRKEEDE